MFAFPAPFLLVFDTSYDREKIPRYPENCDELRKRVKPSIPTNQYVYICIYVYVLITTSRAIHKIKTERSGAGQEQEGREERMKEGVGGRSRVVGLNR